MAEEKNYLQLKIEGMDCANCALGITRKLAKSGHSDVHVNFATGEASLLMKEHTSFEDVVKDVESLGYKVVQAEDKQQFSFGIREKFIFSMIFTLPVFFGHMFLDHDALLATPFMQLLLSLPVVALGFYHFGKSAWGSLKTGIPNMDVLIFIGSFSAFVYSLAGMFIGTSTHEIHQYMFFETADTIITLVFLGNLLEHISVKKTTSAIDDLSALQPATARKIIQSNGTETIQEVPSDSVKPGDILLVNVGDHVPMDGTVISGTGACNESMLTGESTPVDKTEGADIIGGTLLLQGPIRMSVTRTGNQTTLSGIIALVKKAHQEKPPVQQLADKISAIFVPVVIGISLITFFTAYYAFDVSFQKSLLNSIAVLVISCPCAMGLATPTAVMVGIGRAAKSGILIKGGRTLEQLASMKTVVFDKTGTLTTGTFNDLKLNVHSEGADPKVLQQIILAIELHTSHPLAKSVVRLLSNNGIMPADHITEYKEIKGVGMEAIDQDGNHWKLGSWRLTGSAEHKNHDIYLLKNDVIIASIDMKDELRPGMKDVIDFLKANHIKTVLLSGDRKEKCEDVARELGIDEVLSEQLPQQKLDIITKYSSENVTAMVGDGINDAPALTRANIGISPGDATNVAMHASHVLLLKKDDLSGIMDAYLIGKHSLITIRQNLFWAFIYNVIAIPIAATGFLSPMVASLSMAFSDVVVIGNSILLRTKDLE
ncbi:MAG: heavy metal translocating P-type ATPase [Bacteroidia bacterium]